MLVDLKPQFQIDRPKTQVIEEIASCTAESNRIPDPYIFTLTPQGELYSPSAKTKVKDSISLDTYTRRLEYQALEAVEKWARESKRGVIMWVSPPSSEEGYLTSKVIVHELIEHEGQKAVFNRAIVLDIDEERCLEFAQDLARFSNDRLLLSSLDEVRRSPISFNCPQHWTYILEEFLPDLSLKNVRSGEDLKLKEEYLTQARKIYERELAKSRRVDIKLVYQEAARLMFGKNPLSCPPKFTESLFEFAWAHALPINRLLDREWFCKKCPVCKEEINTVVKPGERCPVKRCQALRECA